MAFSFEKLRAYEIGRALAKDVYALTLRFPDYEKFGLCSQIRRAAVSIPSNIAEGSGRMSLKEKAHFIEIAFGSLMETYCQMQIALDLHLQRRI